MKSLLYAGPNPIANLRRTHRAALMTFDTGSTSGYRVFAPMSSIISFVAKMPSFVVSLLTQDNDYQVELPPQRKPRDPSVSGCRSFTPTTTAFCKASRS